MCKTRGGSVAACDAADDSHKALNLFKIGSASTCFAAMLKSLDQIRQPDPLVARTCGRDGRAALTLEEQHDWVAGIELSPLVPEAARQVFDRARNAFVYAWFSYELGALAEGQALFSVEFALRLRLGDRAHENDTLSPLIEKAIKDKVIQENPLGLLPRALVFRTMRNEWAHGSSHIHSPVMTLDLMRACADLISEAFEP